MKMLPINKHLVDIFQGEGWKNWSRVHIITQKLPSGSMSRKASVIGGTKLPTIRLIEIVKSL